MRAMLCSICATTQRSASESLASRPRTDANMSRAHWREDFIETLPDARRWKKHTPRLCDTAMTGRSGDAAAGGRFPGRWLFCRLRFFRCGRLLRPARLVVLGDQVGQRGNRRVLARRRDQMVELAGKAGIEIVAPQAGMAAGERKGVV